MIDCPNCHGPLEIRELACPACGLSHSGRFAQPRLARLARDHQRLVEEIVLAAGNLKEVAGTLDISYPTLRKRLDGLVAALAKLRAADEAETRALLDAVEARELPAEQAARLIREMNGGA